MAIGDVNPRIDPNDPHPFNAHLQESMFSGPIPGQAWTHEYKSMPWQKPPQHTKLEDTMVHLMHQLTEPEHLQQLLQLMDGGMPIEAICRVILMVGFASGKWTPDLASLMYKPLMMSLIAIAHRAKKTDVPIVIKQSLDNHIQDRMRRHVMVKKTKGDDVGVPFADPSRPVVTPIPVDQPGGFMVRPGGQGNI